MSNTDVSRSTYSTSTTRAQVVDYSPAAIASYCGRGERKGKYWKCNCPICGRHSLIVQFHKQYPFKCFYCHDCGINDGCTEQRQYLIDKGLLPADFSIKKLSWKEYRDYCKAERAKAVREWERTVPIDLNGPVASYLKVRGINSFIGHAALRQSNMFCGMMVVRVYHVGYGVSAVQKTWIDQCGTGRDQSEPRKTIGVLSGGGVWINAPRLDEEYVVGEGLETVLSAMLLMGIRCGVAALGSNFKGLVLPSTGNCPVIAADNDDAGRGASDCVCKLWRERKLMVRVVKPDREGDDFNDVLLKGGTWS